MEHKPYYRWSYESSPLIDPFTRRVLIDKWVTTCYNLDCSFLMYGLDKNTNIFWMVLKFGVDDEKSLAQVQYIIPDVKWKHHVYEDDMLRVVVNQKNNLLTGTYHPNYERFVRKALHR